MKLLHDFYKILITNQNDTGIFFITLCIMGAISFTYFVLENTFAYGFNKERFFRTALFTGSIIGFIILVLASIVVGHTYIYF